MSEILANVVVSMPSQLFTLARSFKANANGKIYIGQIDTDPVNPANQIQVYIENEDGSHVPIAQPIVINSGGFPIYNGQIAKFVTVQGHSMAVYDSYGTQQFYYPNVLKYDPDQFSSYANENFRLAVYKRLQNVSFASGATISNKYQSLFYASTGWYYSYIGDLSTPVVVPPGSMPDDNWKSVGNLNGYAYNHFLNFKNELVTDEQALTAAFNTGYEVDLSGAVATTTVNYTIPAGSKGLKGGTLMLGGRLSTVPYDFATAVLLTASVRAGVSVIKLDGIDRTGQLIRFDNGYTFCIDDALASGVTPGSIDGAALTSSLNSYQSQYIQVV
ncbi:bifunctional tail protein [Escherichia coli BIDMC 39]|nr:bifunctional tail protein [Escherichia coli BIDMC 39]